MFSPQARGSGNEAEQPELCHAMCPPAILRLGSTSQSMRRHLFSFICSFLWGSRGGDANPFHSGHSSSFLPASVTPSRQFLLRLFNPFLLSLSPLPPSFLLFFLCQSAHQTCFEGSSNKHLWYFLSPLSFSSHLPFLSYSASSTLFPEKELLQPSTQNVACLSCG